MDSHPAVFEGSWLADCTVATSGRRDCVGLGGIRQHEDRDIPCPPHSAQTGLSG